MNSNEYAREKGMGYDCLVRYLLSKYGAATENFFIDESCKTKNKRVTRTKEGLYCHHIWERDYIDLSQPTVAKNHSFEYQKAYNLVYCNLLEHFLLHLFIYREKNGDWNLKSIREKGEEVKPRKKTWNTNSAYKMKNMLPISGGTWFILKDCNELFEGQGSAIRWKQNCYEQIRDNLNDYTDLLAELVQACIYSFTGNKEHKDKTLQVGTKIQSRTKGIGIIEQIENGLGDISLPEFQWLIVKFDNETIRIPRDLIDMGDYNTELDRIIDELSKDHNENICKEVRNSISHKVKR